MATSTFVLKEPSSKERTIIYLIFRFGSQRLKYSTGQKIEPKFWNSSSQRARETRQFPEYPELNALLDNYSVAAINIYRKLLNDGEVITTEKIKAGLDETFKQLIEPSHKKDFFAFIETFIETANKKESTKKSYKQALRVLREYQTLFNQPITFDNIDLDFYERFTKYLAETGYYENTIGKFIKIVKVFMNEALERGLTTNVIFKHKKFKKVTEESESIYLTKDEIDAINKLDLSDNEKLLNVRDLFVIGCYTGLRFSDLNKLSDKHIFDNGTKLRIQTEKTGEKIVIPLHSHVRNILTRHGGSIPKVISNQKMNEYLKEIGEKAKVKDKVTVHFTKGGKKTSDTFAKHELITVHTARRSFATNAYLSDIPTISIMKITGHRTEVAFMKYIKISQEDNANKLLNHPFFVN